MSPVQSHFYVLFLVLPLLCVFGPFLCADPLAAAQSPAGSTHASCLGSLPSLALVRMRAFQACVTVYTLHGSCRPKLSLTRSYGRLWVLPLLSRPVSMLASLKVKVSLFALALSLA